MPTIRDLSETIDTQAVIEAAREHWTRRHKRSRDFTQWLVHLLPWFQFISFWVFYLLSAPHTVALMERITPGAGKLAPVGFELGVVFVSAMRQYGWKNALTFSILYALLLISILINIAGGLISVVETGAAVDISGLTLPELVGQYAVLPVQYQVVLPLVVLVGVLIPVMGKFSGEAMIKIATGEVKLSSLSLDDMWLRERYEVARSALFRAALEVGAGTVTAGKWAAAVATQLYGDDVTPQAPTRASGQLVRTVHPVRTVRAVHEEFGFARLAQVQKDTPDASDSPDTRTSGAVLTRQAARDWLKAHPDTLNALRTSAQRRAMAEDVSLQITGSTSGYKTIERAVKDLTD